MKFRLDFDLLFGKAMDRLFALALTQPGTFQGAARPILLGHADGDIAKAQALALEGLRTHLHVLQQQAPRFLDRFNNEVSYAGLRVPVAGKWRPRRYPRRRRDTCSLSRCRHPTIRQGTAGWTWSAPSSMAAAGASWRSAAARYRGSRHRTRPRGLSRQRSGVAPAWRSAGRRRSRPPGAGSAWRWRRGVGRARLTRFDRGSQDASGGPLEAERRGIVRYARKRAS